MSTYVYLPSRTYICVLFFSCSCLQSNVSVWRNMFKWPLFLSTRQAGRLLSGRCVKHSHTKKLSADPISKVYCSNYFFTLSYKLLYNIKNKDKLQFCFQIVDYFNNCTCIHCIITHCCYQIVVLPYYTEVCIPACLNGGQCRDGRCVCPSTHEGSLCENGRLN